MPMPPASAQSARFGPFKVDFRARQLLKNGRRIRLQDQPLQVLGMLLEHPGEVVTREELRVKLWPADTFVDFDHGLNNAINRLRETLCDSAEKPRYIETLPRCGYRFMEAVESLAEPGPAAAASSASPGLPSPSPAATASHYTRWVAGVAVLVIIIAVAWKIAGTRREASASAGGKIHSIAVLPLENLTGDSSQEYFADGITDALITELAQFSSLRVISRTSAMHYKGSRQPLPEIAKELNVDAVVEGSVSRSGNRVRITAQLLEARADRHLWAKAYDRDVREIASLQQDVADSIVSEIQPKLRPRGSASVSRKRQVNPEAYDDYLRGLYFWNKFTEASERRAVEYFEESIRKDPSYALGYAWLAHAYHELAEKERPKDLMPKSKEAAEKALQLDDTLAEAHAALGWVKWVYDCDWPGAEKEFQRAVQLNPGQGIVHGMYAQYLDSLGRFEGAFRERQMARELDPVSLGLIANAAEHFRWMRQYDKAIEENRRALDMDPSFPDAHGGLALAYMGKGMYEESIKEMEQVAILDGKPDLAETMKLAYARGGYKGALKSQLKYYKDRRSAGSYVAYWDEALTHAQLGNKELALQALEKAYAEREDIDNLSVNPSWDFIRADPRFQDLVRRAGPPVNGAGAVVH
jgi:TolB-like protein/DNA-binding winged helix-turn-helix (wHTH) protein/Tfp pilus assembly protein PilF